MFLSKHNLCTVSSHPLFYPCFTAPNTFGTPHGRPIFLSLLGYPETTPDKNHKCQMHHLNQPVYFPMEQIPENISSTPQQRRQELVKVVHLFNTFQYTWKYFWGFSRPICAQWFHDSSWQKPITPGRPSPSLAISSNLLRGRKMTTGDGF